MIEPHTMLYQKRIKPISEDMDALMYKTIIKTLEKKGYHHMKYLILLKKVMCQSII